VDIKKILEEFLKEFFNKIKAWLINFMIPWANSSKFLILKEYNIYEKWLNELMKRGKLSSEEFKEFSGLIKNALKSLESDKKSENAKEIIARLNNIYGMYLMSIMTLYYKDGGEFGDFKAAIRKLGEDVSGGGISLKKIIEELKPIVPKGTYDSINDFNGFKEATNKYLCTLKEDDGLNMIGEITVRLNKIIQEVC